MWARPLTCRSSSLGGSYQNRIRLPVEVVKAVRQRIGSDFIIIYRLSMLDLVENGSTWEEVVEVCRVVVEYVCPFCRRLIMSVMVFAPPSWHKPSRRRARQSSTRVLAGTRRACRQLPQWFLGEVARGGRRSDLALIMYDGQRCICMGD